MTEFGSFTDLLPDNDSFLPRYLTVQLLALLATTPIKPAAETSYSQRSAEFVAAFKKNQELFNPLTYAIFWRENVAAALQQNPQLIDTTDKYNRSPLTLALANEDFVLANQLVEQGANVYMEDKLVLEITLLSMIQRDQKIIDTILAAPAEYDLSWVREYLEYLRSYVDGQPLITPTRFHDILNPPIRHFGQVLDTLSYFNGLPSHYGFLSPSISVLSTHLNKYAQDLADPATKDMFSSIANAFADTQNLCKFHGNVATLPGGAKALTTKIRNNLKSNSKQPAVLFGGWAGDSVAIAFVNKYLIFSNLGVGGNPAFGTTIFTISNPDAITETFVANFIQGLGAATAPTEILSAIGEFVDQEPIYILPQTLNQIDNCIFVNPRAVIQGILLVLHTYNKSGSISAANLATAAAAVSDLYTNYVNSLYKNSTADLAKFMRNHELLQNKRIECCSLAIDYINQHYQDPDALPRCIQLKNALEFVGLKDYYSNKVDQAAKTAIQKFMIHEQEVTAIKVIEQEYAIAAAQAAAQ